jgi:transcriptional regulator NrdR family protein
MLCAADGPATNVEDGSQLSNAFNCVRLLLSSGMVNVLYLTAKKSSKQSSLEALKAIDPVGYVRYASVYRDFTDPGDFAKFIEESALKDEGPGA